MKKLRITIIVLLTLIVTTISVGCGSTTAETTAEVQESETPSTEIATTPEVAVEDIAEPEIDIPLFCSASCDHWVSQNGEIITPTAADDFFDRNPGLAQEILYLNLNYLYATNLYSVEREEMLWDKMDQYVTGQDEVSCDNLQQVYYDALSTQKVDSNSIRMLLSRLYNNTAAEDISALYHNAIDTSSIRDDATDNDSIIRRLFFAQLIAFTKDGRFDKLCLDKDVEAMAIPILLDQDGVWYDQNNFPMEATDVEEFFRQHEKQAERIVRLNFYSNPFLNAEDLDTATYEKLNAMIMPFFDTYGDIDLCLETLNHGTIYDIDSDALIDLAYLISEMPTDQHCRCYVLEGMNELVGYDLYQIQSINTYGFYGESTDLMRYMFINALTKKVKTNIGPV